MPIISMFYGIIIRMYTEPGNKHLLPHIHRDDLEADWKIALSGEKVFRIDPLK